MSYQPTDWMKLAREEWGRVLDEYAQSHYPSSGVSYYQAADKIEAIIAKHAPKPAPVPVALRQAVEKAVSEWYPTINPEDTFENYLVAAVAPLLAAKDAEVARLWIGADKAQNDLITDLRAQLAAVTRERDEARTCLGGFRETVRRISGERDDLRRVISSLDAYVAYLGEAERMTVGFLHVHGWRYPDDLLARGEKLRAEIATARALVPQPEAQS